MSTPSNQWKYLAINPKSAYRQLFVKGTRIRAEVLYGLHVDGDAAEERMMPEEIAADYDLPLEAVMEAIASCQSNPSEIAQDHALEEALMEATGMNDPQYKFHPTPKSLSPQERARINGL